MTPKARDLQEPGQHDMIEALRDALRQDNSEELNPRMREALKGFRKDLHVHPYVRALERHRTSSRSTRLRLLVPAGAALAGLVAVVGLFMVLTGMPRTDVLAAVIETMAEVKTAHIVTDRRVTDNGVELPQEGDQTHIWYSAEHGARWESRWLIRAATTEATWEYWHDSNTVVVSEPLAERTHLLFGLLSGVDILTTLQAHDSPQVRYQQEDTRLDGVRVIRIVVQVDGDALTATLWIDKATLRVLAWDEIIRETDSRKVEHSRKMEYDMPLDPALFTFEIPEGATVEDRRGAAEPQEGSQ